MFEDILPNPQHDVRALRIFLGVIGGLLLALCGIALGAANAVSDNTQTVHSRLGHELVVPLSTHNRCNMYELRGVENLQSYDVPLRVKNTSSETVNTILRVNEVDNLDESMPTDTNIVAVVAPPRTAGVVNVEVPSVLKHKPYVALQPGELLDMSRIVEICVGE